MIVPKIVSFAIATGSLILILGLPGCGPDLDLGCVLCGEYEVPDPPEVRSVAIVPDSVTLSVGQKVTLRAIVTLVDGSVLESTTVSFWSSDTTVATVSIPGTGFGPTAEVTGRAIGTAWITAYRSKKSDQAKVIVN